MVYFSSESLSIYFSISSMIVSVPLEPWLLLSKNNFTIWIDKNVIMMLF